MATPTFDPCTPSIGAEVLGIDIAEGVDPATADVVHGALMEHHVLFFRDQDVRPGHLAAFASSFGPLEGAHHTYPSLEDEHVMLLDLGPQNPPDSAEWHSDLTYRQDAPFASVLQAVEVPPAGGDTLWANLFDVHDALDEGLRKDLSGLSAVHDIGSFRNHAFLGTGVDGINALMSEAGSAVHPVIDHHPVTVRPYVNVNETFTVHVLGLSRPEGIRLLSYLFDLINRPQFHVRLRWSPGTVAMWDNRGTQHYAVGDYLPHRRVMHRVVVASDIREPGSEAAREDREA